MIERQAGIMNAVDLPRQVIGLAMKVHRKLGPGFLENLYKNALAYELEKAAIPFSTEEPLAVYYEDRLIGDYYADILIQDSLIIELKAVSTLSKVHSLQLVNYLNAAQIEEGLLLNFGAPQLEFRTKTRHYQKSDEKDLHFR